MGEIVQTLNRFVRSPFRRENVDQLVPGLFVWQPFSSSSALAEEGLFPMLWHPKTGVASLPDSPMKLDVCSKRI